VETPARRGTFPITYKILNGEFRRPKAAYQKQVEENAKQFIFFINNY
jgi:hypothetical protein